MTDSSPVPGPALSLRREEAEARRALLDVTGYELDLDLTGADSSEVTTYAVRTRIRFTSGAGDTFVDLKPARLGDLRLDGEPLDTGLLAQGRFPLSLTAGDHLLEVSSTMPLRHDGEGLHRTFDPADGRAYLYAMCFMDAAPSITPASTSPTSRPPRRCGSRRRRRGPSSATAAPPGSATDEGWRSGSWRPPSRCRRTS